MSGTTVPTGRAMTVDTLQEGGTSGANEDALLVSGHVYGVFDGAGGASAATIASEVFGEKTLASLGELSTEANARIAAAKARAGESGAMFGATAAVVRFERDVFDWLLVGDSQIVVVLPDGSFEALSPEGAKAARLDGQPGSEVFARSGRHKLAGVRHVLVFTDGFLVPRAEAGAPADLGAMVNAFLEGGLRGAFTATRASAVAGGEVAAIALSFLPPNPARTSKKKGKKKSGARKSGVPSRRRKGPRPSSV